MLDISVVQQPVIGCGQINCLLGMQCILQTGDFGSDAETVLILTYPICGRPGHGVAPRARRVTAWRDRKLREKKV